MKSIALVFEYPTLNGGERSMLAVLDRLAGGDFEFVGLAPPEGRLADALERRNLPHVPLVLADETGTRLPREAAARNLQVAVRATDPDLVHANSLAMGRLTGALAGELRVPTVAHLRDILRLSQAAVRDLNGNRRLAAVSRATREFHISQGLSADRTGVLYNGVDTNEFRPRGRTGFLRRELQLPDDAFLIATIGQIGLRKGQDVLAEASALLGARLPAVHYLLVGERNSSKPESIDFERHVIARFAQAGLADRLHRLGYRSDVARLLGEVDLLVHPAHQEPLGRVLLEAAASGVPIVATNVGGTPEILEDGASARLVRPRNPQALADAILELASDANLRARFARQARATIEARFSIDRAAAALAALWNEAVLRSLNHRG